MQLYNGDCIEVIKGLDLPDGVDLVLTDPPYSSGGVFAGDRKQSTKKKYTDDDANGAARFQDFSGDNMDQRSYTEFLRQIFSVARSKAKPGAVIASFIDWRNLPALTDAIQAAGWVWRGVAIWNKMNSRPQMGRFRNQCEYIVWGSNGPMPVERGVGVLPGVYEYVNVPSAQRNHQTEKPVELMRDILEIVPKGSLVLDPFMGSGSTGVACVLSDRDFIGVELCPGYFETAKARIAQAQEEAEQEKAQGCLW